MLTVNFMEVWTFMSLFAFSCFSGVMGFSASSEGLTVAGSGYAERKLWLLAVLIGSLAGAGMVIVYTVAVACANSCNWAKTIMPQLSLDAAKAAAEEEKRHVAQQLGDPRTLLRVCGRMDNVEWKGLNGMLQTSVGTASILALRAPAGPLGRLDIRGGALVRRYAGAKGNKTRKTASWRRGRVQEPAKRNRRHRGARPQRCQSHWI